MISRKRGDSGDGGPPPIIIKRPHRPRGHHGGAWKVAYADFVTTMMALFIVLWAVQQNPEIRTSIASYFRDPAIVPQSQERAGVLPANRGVVALAAQSGAAERDGSEREAQAMQAAAAQLRNSMEKDPELQSLRDQVRIEVTPEGLRIQLIERDNSLLFNIGSAGVKPALTRLLSLVAEAVRALPNNIIVEGHTDSRQYSSYTNGYSNWELSADRANAARRVLEAAGLVPGRITRVVGYADRDLLLPAEPLNAQNRRVSVIVRRIHGVPDAHPGVRPDQALGGLAARADVAAR